MGNFREDVINAVKAMNITQEELGFKPIEIRTIDTDFLDGVKKYIQQVEEVEAARECIPESYWKELGILEEKYKVLEVTLQKEIYKKIKVVVPEDYNDLDKYDLGDLESISYSNYDVWDEEDWIVYDTDDIDNDLTAYDVNINYSDAWNIDDFETSQF